MISASLAIYIGPAFVFKIAASTTAPSSKNICLASPITVLEDR
jgi:hypothetical protein